MRSTRPRRGRPPKASGPMTCAQQAPTLDLGCDAIVKGGVRSVRSKNVKRSDETVNDRDDGDALKSTVSTKEYQSAIARHLSFNSECNDDFVMTVLVFYHVLGLAVTLIFRIGIHSCATS